VTAKRITKPLLDVLETLLAAPDSGMHGWGIAEATNRMRPTVYKILERLASDNLVAAQWELVHPVANRPRRRFYRLTPEGVQYARGILAERRPQASA
jgi:PadR family transcriptional regulator PadR